MDALAGLLNGPRARGAFLLRILLDPPWSIRIQDEAPLAIVTIMRGDMWVIPDNGAPVRMTAGDVAVVRGPDPHTVADDPATPPQVIVHPGDRCATPDGQDLHEVMDLGVRSWGTNPDGSLRMLVGTYHMRGEVGQRLLGALPGLIVLPERDWDNGLARLLDEEVARDEPGQNIVLDRLLDLLLVTVLRAWFSRPEAEVPAWYRALGDPVVGRALRLLHNDPGYPWTVAELAAKSQVSRAALARRFTELVGEPPMTYLTGWRLDLAADLLREPDATIGAVARQVGYGSPFALSTAFKRVRGISPQQYRVGAAEYAY